MATRIWTFRLDGIEHTVELQHGTISGIRTILLDGNVIDHGKQVIDTGSTHRFQIAQHSGSVSIRTNGVTFNYDFALDGHSLGTGATVSVRTPVLPEQLAKYQDHDATDPSIKKRLQYLLGAFCTVFAGFIILMVSRGFGTRGEIGCIQAVGILVIVVGLGLFFPVFGLEMPGRRWQIRCPRCGNTFYTDAVRDREINPTQTCPNCGYEVHW